MTRSTDGVLAVVSNEESMPSGWVRDGVELYPDSAVDLITAATV